MVHDQWPPKTDDQLIQILLALTELVSALFLVNFKPMTENAAWETIMVGCKKNRLPSTNKILSNFICEEDQLIGNWARGGCGHAVLGNVISAIGEGFWTRASIYYIQKFF